MENVTIFNQKRNCERVDMLSPASLRSIKSKRSGKEISGVVVDISACGAYIQTSEPVQKDDLIVLDVDLIQLNEKMSATGKVVRLDEAGIGVSFLSRYERLEKVKAI